MRFAAAQADLPALDAKQELRSNMLVDTMTEIFDKTVGPAFAAANAGAPEGKLIIKKNLSFIGIFRQSEEFLCFHPRRCGRNSQEN